MNEFNANSRNIHIVNNNVNNVRSESYSSGGYGFGGPLIGLLFLIGIIWGAVHWQFLGFMGLVLLVLWTIDQRKKKRAALAARAKQENDMYLRGDPRGTYGTYDDGIVL